MKAVIGTAAAGLMIVGIAACPDHVRDRAQVATGLPREVHEEFARQWELATAVIPGEHERPEIKRQPSPYRESNYRAVIPVQAG